MIVLSAALIAGMPLEVLAGNGGGKSPGMGKSTVATMPLNSTEQSDLLFMREEEKLARDVYDEMYDTWAAAIFNNISNAEQRHMDALKELVDKYGLAALDPIVEDERGAFENDYFREQYLALIKEGGKSITAAVWVGARIEELDIEDLELAIENTNHDDIIQVYENLRKGSRNHLRAFARQWENMTGEAYSAQVLSQDLVDEIVNAPMERRKTNTAKRRGRTF